MEPTRANRRLSAILMADVVGYSRLMGADEEATVSTLRAYREVFTETIPNFNGRVVDAKGDALMAEFAAVTEALACAVKIQGELAERNSGLPVERRMDFRIGINLGEVLVEGDEIFGDGINVAARLEGLAEPGGITVSGAVYDAVKGKLGLEFQSLGAQKVKNIADPVRTFRVLSKPGAAAHRVVRAGRLGERKGKIIGFVGAAAIVAAFIAVGVYYLQPTGEPADTADLKTGPSVSDRPSIAVLAFKNLSGDPEQEYFADGFSEDIITSLSKIKRMRVIARESTFRYKNQPLDVRDVGRELGVRYVLEGSIRKVGDRVRINAQLIDASDGSHIWAETYDRVLTDVFAIQDEIKNKIVTELDVMLTEGEQIRAWRRGTENLEAYETMIKGYELFLLQTPEAMDQAERLFRKTIELDPNYAMPYVNLGYNTAVQAQLGFVDNLEDALENAAELAHKALQIDDQLPDAYCMLGYVRAGQHRFDEGIRLARRCVELDPNRAKMNAILGQNYVFAGQNDEGIDYMSRALRLNPYPPPWYNEILGSAYLRGGQLEKSIQLLSETLPSVPRDDLWFQTQYRLHLIVAYDKLGRTDAIERLVSEVLTVNPAFRITEFTGFDKSVYKDQDRFEEWVQSLRKAGLPE